MSLVELGLGLDLNPFLAQLATAEGALKRVKVQGQSGVTLRASLDTSSIWPSLEAVKKTLAKEKVTLKVATEFYRVGSGNSISAKSLKEGVLKNVQQTVNSSDDYKIKIGTTFKFDQGTTRQIKSLIKELDASIERFNATKAAASSASTPVNVGSVRQRLSDLTKPVSQGGLNPNEIRRLAKEASKFGIETSTTDATQLRKQLRSQFMAAGEDAVKGLAKGLVDDPSVVLRGGGKLVDTLIKGLKDALEIRSPSERIAKEAGKPSGEGWGKGAVEGVVAWERRLATTIRQVMGNAVQQGLARDQAARGALMNFGKDAGATIATSLGKALKQGLASSVAPALKGGLLGATGGFATGGLVGAATTAGGAIKQAVMPAMTTFGYSSMPEKLGMLGKGSASLVSGQASDAFNQFLQSSVDSVLNAALSSGGQGALLGAAGVAGVAGVAGLAKGAGGSLVSQAIESIKNRITGSAAKAAIQEAAAIEVPPIESPQLAGDSRQLAQLSDPLKKYKLSLTKAQKELLEYAFQFDNLAEGTTASNLKVFGIEKLAAKMELTADQLNAIAIEFATNPVIDDISSYADELGKSSERVARAIENKLKALTAELNATQISLLDSQSPAAATAANIGRSLTSTAIVQAQAQTQLPGSTADAVVAPIENAGNVMGLLQDAIAKIAKGVLDFAGNLMPGKIKENGEKFGWALLQAAEQFEILKKDAQVLGGKVKLLWTDLEGTTPQRLLPPKPVPGTGLIRERNIQLGDVVGRTATDFGGQYIEQTRKDLKGIFGKPGEWKIVDEANGVWQGIKTDSQLARERLKIIANALTTNKTFLDNPSSRYENNQVTRSRMRVWTDREGVGAFNPFDPAFYRPIRSAQEPPARGGDVPPTQFGKTGVDSQGRDVFSPTGGGGGFNFGGNRFGSHDPAGALALRNVPVEFLQSFRDAEQLIARISERMAALNKAFSSLGVVSQPQVNQFLRELQVNLRAVEQSFGRSEISGSDFLSALYGYNRQLAGLTGKTAEVQNLAQAFSDLGIESNAALKSINDQRNISLDYIQKNNTISDSEKTRAANARDIQQASFINDQIRVAQAASGFGGFRGREIGNKTLIDRQQRSELANAIRQLKEYGDQITDAGYSTETFKDIQKATAAEIKNAELALRVLQGEAKDGERIILAARNAWGTILDDFQNLVPQLLVFAVAYNLILQRVMTTPGAVIQAAASFDRLETSISSYLSATRGIGDSSAVIGDLKQVALDLGIGFEKAASSYLRFAAATQGTPLQGQEVDITRTLATAGRNQGLSGEQIDRASTALTQILSKGTVQSEELRGQLAEQLPGALQVAARAFGVTTKELYRMVEAGQIAGDEFVAKFIGQLKAEGADVNQLAGNFTNVTEQLGSSLQMFAAAAGEPFLQPLTLALRGLNAAVTALIPLGAPLAAMFIAIGSTAAKTALQIKGTWGQAIAEAVGTAMDGESSILGPDGKPLKSGRGQQFKDGLQQARQGVSGLGAALSGRSSGEGVLKSMASSARELGTGLKGAAVASLNLGTGLKTALASALKLYLAIEGISFAIKLATGQIGKLNDEQQKSSRILNKGIDGGQQYNGLQKVLSAFNVGRMLETSLTQGRTRQIVENTQETRKRIDANQGLIAKKSKEWVAIDRQLYEKRAKLRDTDSAEQDKALKSEIKTLEEKRAGIVNSLPRGIRPNDVQAQITLQQAAIQAAEERKKKLEDLNFLPWETNAIAEEKKLIASLEASNQELEKRLKLYENLGQIPTIAGLQAQLKKTEDYLGTVDVNSSEFTRAQAVAAGRRKVIEDLQKLPEEQKLIELEAQQRLITAEVQKQEAIAKIKLGRLESEKKLIEANLSLEQTRTRLQESIFDRRAQIARAVGDTSSAFQADAQGRQARDAGQSREIAVQAQLIDKERERSRIETGLQREQIRLQQQQITIDLQMLEIERVKLAAASKEKGVSDELFKIYTNTLRTLTATINAVKQQSSAQAQLLPLLDQQQATQEAVFDKEKQRLIVQQQINAVTSDGESALAEIEQRKERINAAESVSLARVKDVNDSLDRAVEKSQAQLDLARANVEAQRERLRMAEELASAEMEALDRAIQMQSTRLDGGFFERMAKFTAIGNTNEADTLSLAERRAQLMRQIKDQQDKQKAADLDIKQREIATEKILLDLKVQQLRLSNEESKIRLRAAASRLRMAYEQKGDSAGVQRIDQFYQQLGFNNPGDYGSGLGAQEFELKTGVKGVLEADQSIKDIRKSGNAILDSRTALLKDQISYTNQLNSATSQLLELDASAWFANFLDESTSLGRVLSSAAEGISQFRQSVSTGLIEGLLGGDGATAISNAGNQLASKLLTSLVDEYVMKPMEQNLFTGLSKLLGVKQPETEQQAIARNTERQAAVAEQTRTAIGALDQALSNINQNLTQGFQAVVNVITQQPLLPSAQAQSSPAASAPSTAVLAGSPIRGAIANRVRDPDREATGWDIVVPGGVGGRISNPFGRMRVTGTGFQGSGSGPSGRGYGNWVSGEVEVAGKIFDILLGHLQKINVKQGDLLGPGATIGLQGETGRTFGTHVTTHVNPLGGASVNDAWNVLEKLTRAWESGTIVPSSGGRQPALGPQSNSAIGDQFTRLLDMEGGLATVASGGAVPVQVVGSTTRPWSGESFPLSGSPLGVEPAPLPPVESKPGSPVPLQVMATGAFSEYTQGILKLNESILNFSTGMDLSAGQLSSLQQNTGELSATIASSAQAAQQVPSKFQSLSNTIGGVVSLLGGLGMGFAGAQQVKQGGTYNTLMGLAGIFGSVSSIAGAFGTGGPFSGVFSKPKSITDFTSGITGSLGGFRASGGPVTARKSYIVGEKGMEVFLPQTSGTIIPNNRLRSALAADSNVDPYEATANYLEQMSVGPIAAKVSNEPIRIDSRVINGVEYVTMEQLQEATQRAESRGAERGRALAIGSMRNSVKTRKQLGIA